MELYIKTDLEILKSLGLKIKEIRLEQNITQAMLSEMSGVSLRRIGDVEGGENHSTLILIQILRALHSLELLSKFFTERQISPIEYAKLHSFIDRPKRRARYNIKEENIWKANFLEEDEQW